MKEKKQSERKKQPLTIRVEIFPKENTSIPTLDWLQFMFGGMFQEAENYDDRPLDYGTRSFANVIEAWQGNWRKATIVNEPKSPLLRPDMNLIKLDNRECYWKNPVARLIECGQAHNLQFLKSSRIDIAVDFNTFAFGLHPVTLIDGFYSNKYLKQGMKNYTIRGKQTFEANPHYLKFETIKCPVSAYLYNKSKELRDVKKKNYIIKHWKDNGLDITRDVWRLEFSMHTQKFVIYNKNTKERELFNPLLLDDSLYLRTVLLALINKYWVFRKNDHHKKIYQMRKINFFNKVNETYHIQFLREDKDAGRSDIIFLNKLKDLNNECRANAKVHQAATQEIEDYYKISRNLHKDKFGNYSKNSKIN